MSEADTTRTADRRGLVTTVAQRDVPIYSEAVGTTEGFVNAQVRPRVQGYLLRQTYGDGASVKAGDLLFEIDDRQYRAALDEARGNLARQQAALKKYELDVARYTPLEAKGAVSREELDDAVQAARGAKAQVDAAAAAVETARLNLGWTRVYAPIAGVAGIAPVQVGDLVTPSTLLDDDLAARPDQGDVPDQRARVPAIRRSHSGAPAERSAARTSRRSR